MCVRVCVCVCVCVCVFVGDSGGKAVYALLSLPMTAVAWVLPSLGCYNGLLPGLHCKSHSHQYFLEHKSGHVSRRPQTLLWFPVGTLGTNRLLSLPPTQVPAAYIVPTDGDPNPSFITAEVKV
jgi:hypothetical protein